MSVRQRVGESVAPTEVYFRLSGSPQHTLRRESVEQKLEEQTQERKTEQAASRGEKAVVRKRSCHIYSRV